MADRELIARLQSGIRSIEQGGSPRAATSKAEPCPGPFGDDGESGRVAEPRQEAGDAFRKIIALVNVSDRSEAAIRTRLARCGFSEQDIDDSVARAKECGFIDDIRYGEVLVRSRISQGKGSVLIERELAENGIDPYEVPGWPHDFPLSFEDELERSLDILGRKPPRSKNMREGAYRKLVQKGYPSAVASSAARLWEERNSL